MEEVFKQLRLPIEDSETLSVKASKLFPEEYLKQQKYIDSQHAAYQEWEKLKRESSIPLKTRVQIYEIASEKFEDADYKSRLSEIKKQYSSLKGKRK